MTPEGKKAYTPERGIPPPPPSLPPPPRGGGGVPPERGILHCQVPPPPFIAPAFLPPLNRLPGTHQPQGEGGGPCLAGRRGGQRGEAGAVQARPCAAAARRQVRRRGAAVAPSGRQQSASWSHLPSRCVCGGASSGEVMGGEKTSSFWISASPLFSAAVSKQPRGSPPAPRLSHTSRIHVAVLHQSCSNLLPPMRQTPLRLCSSAPGNSI